MLALERDDAVGHAINLGTGASSTVEDVARALANGLGLDIGPERLHQFRAGDIRHCYADTRRASKLLGFDAEVSLETGMGDLIRWLEGQQADDTVDQATEELTSRGLTTGITPQR